MLALANVNVERNDLARAGLLGREGQEARCRADVQDSLPDDLNIANILGKLAPQIPMPAVSPNPGTSIM